MATKTPTPATPGTYLPVPGQVQDNSNPDTDNATKIAARNTTSSETAATTNEIVVDPKRNDGKLYVGGQKTINNLPAAQIMTQIPGDGGTGADGAKGDRGDKGDKGDKGDTGPSEPVDYDRIQRMIDASIAKALNFKNLKFKDPVPTQVFGGKSISLPVELYDALTSTGVTVIPTYTLGLTTVGSISNSGLFTALNPATDTRVTVTADYTDPKDSKKYTVSTNITVKTFKVSSLSVTGPSSVNSAGVATFAATASYTDGTTKLVTADSNTVWTIASGTIGTLTKNVLAAATVTSAASGSVKATYIEDSVSVSGTASISIVAPQLMPFYGAAAHPVSATNLEPSAYSGWSSFVNALSGRGTTAGRNNTFTVNQAAGQYGWYAYPKSYGLMTQDKIKGNSQPGPGAWDSAQAPNSRTGSFWGATGPLEISVVVNGTAVPFYLYRTDNVAVNETWVVTL